MDVISRIKDCIKNSNLTQKEISEKMGISEDSMVRYLKGTSQFKLNQLIQLSEILQITLSELLTKESVNELTEEEKELLEAYRIAEPGMKNAARKLLDLPEIQGKSSDWMPGEEVI